MTFSDRNITEKENQFWDVEDRLSEFNWSEILLWSLLLFWLCILFFGLIGVNHRITILFIPLSYVPHNWSKKLPFTKLVYDTTIGSKPDSTTIVNILALIILLLFEFLIIITIIGILMLINFFITWTF